MYLRCEFIKKKKNTSKKFWAEFVLALCVVYKKLVRSHSEVVKQLTAIYQSVAASCLVDHSHVLVSVKIYFAPQYDRQLFVSQHFLGQSPLQRNLLVEGN
jgi:hypothetical protein